MIEASATPPRATFVAAGREVIASPEQEPERLVETVIGEYGAIDAVVSNDWCLVGAAPIEDAPLDEYRTMLDALMVRPFSLLKSVVPHMKRRRGSIILLTSGAALRPAGGSAMYSSARAGATAMALSLRSGYFTGL